MYELPWAGWGSGTHVAAGPESPVDSDRYAFSGLLASMLDAIDYGLMVLGRDATILLANQLACDEIGREKWVRQTGERIDGCDTRSATLIGRALREAQRARRSLISLGHAEDTLALSFVPLRVPGVQPGRHAVRPAVLVVFGKRAVCETLTLRMYGDLHGLSGAETQLLPGISRGLSAEEIAGQHHVAVSTVRSQLGSIRAKTGVKSMRSLVACLVTLPPIRPMPTSNGA